MKPSSRSHAPPGDALTESKLCPTGFASRNKAAVELSPSSLPSESSDSDCISPHFLSLRPAENVQDKRGKRQEEKQTPEFLQIFLICALPAPSSQACF